MSWNPVVDVIDYHDFPRRGVAFKDGQLVYFECPFDKAGDEYSAVFSFKVIGRDLLPLVEERREIFKRWKEAVHSATTTDEAMPALPADQPRWNALSAILDPEMKLDPLSAPKARPTFRPTGTELFEREVNWDE
jgi:hypothetical protein